MMGVVLGGYILRLGLLVARRRAVPARRLDAARRRFAITLGVSHLGLLLWELRHVAGSLAFPGLKPTSASTDPNKD